MSLFRHVRPLLTVRSGTTTDQLGPVYAVLPSDSDTTPDYAMELRLMVQLPTPPPVIRGVPLPGLPSGQDCVCPVHPAPVASPVVVAPVPAAVPPIEPAPVAVGVPGPEVGEPVAPTDDAPNDEPEGPADEVPVEEDEVPEPEPEPVPIATVVVETSTDRVSWAPVSEPVAVSELPVFTDVIVLGPYVRARTSSAGLDHEVEVKLLANASFRLELA